jgi:hypothetical protein
VNFKCCAIHELKSSVNDLKSIVGGGGGEKDDDFMLNSQETSPGKLAIVATTQESASYSTREIWVATIENNIEKVTNKP